MNQNIRCFINEGLPLETLLNRMNYFHIFSVYFFNVIDVVLFSVPRSAHEFYSSRFSD